MNTVTGTVTEAWSDSKTSKAGKPFRLHYIRLDDGTQVNVGFNNPHSVGDGVSLNVEEKYGELQVIRGPAKAPPAAMKAPTPTTATKNKHGPLAATDKDMCIIRQNALTNANSLLSSYAMSNPSAIPENMDEMTEMLISIAYDLADFSSGKREEKIAMARVSDDG